MSYIHKRTLKKIAELDIDPDNHNKDASKCAICMAKAVLEGEPTDSLSDQEIISRLADALREFVACWEEMGGNKSAGCWLDSDRFKRARSVLKDLGLEKVE